MTWRYAQVLVGFESDGDPDYSIMEVYFDEHGLSNSFCPARFSNAEDLKLALESIEKHNPVTSFFYSGKFTWNIDKGNYDYEAIPEESHECSEGEMIYKRKIFKEKTGFTPENFILRWNTGDIKDIGDNMYYKLEALFLRE